MPLRPRKFTLPVWMRIPLAAIALLAVLPIFSKVAGFSFLPSSDWIAKTQGVSILAGGHRSYLYLVGCREDCKHDRRSRLPKNHGNMHCSDLRI